MNISIKNFIKKTADNLPLLDLTKIWFFTLLLSKLLVALPFVSSVTPELFLNIQEFITVSEHIWLAAAVTLGEPFKHLKNFVLEIKDDKNMTIIEDQSKKIETLEEQVSSLIKQIEELKADYLTEAKESAQNDAKREILERKMKEDNTINQTHKYLSIAALSINITYNIYKFIYGETNGGFTDDDREILKDLFSIVKNTTQVRPDPSNPIFDGTQTLDEIGTIISRASENS
jgi:hypothetical protein